MRWLMLGVVLSALLPSWARPADADVAASCPAVPMASLALPATRAAIESGEPVVIVALGSSSSRGAGASDPAHSYPAVLQARLSRLLPMAEIAVINRGNDGEDARQELARLDTDVIALRPKLVIWQVGANGAMSNVDPAIFSAAVAKGVSLLRAAGADVIMMDNQRAPRILDAPRHAAIERALADVATAGGVNLFSRGALMDAWRDRGVAYDRFIGPDGLHHNDLGYRCMGEAIATAVTAAAMPAPPRVTASLAAAIPSAAGRPTGAPSQSTAR